MIKSTIRVEDLQRWSNACRERGAIVVVDENGLIVRRLGHASYLVSWTDLTDMRFPDAAFNNALRFVCASRREA